MTKLCEYFVKPTCCMPGDFWSFLQMCVKCVLIHVSGCACLLGFQQQMTDVNWKITVLWFSHSVVDNWFVSRWDHYPHEHPWMGVLTDMCPPGVSWGVERLGRRVRIASSLWDNANSCFKGTVTVDVPSSTWESSCCCRSLPALSIIKLFHFCQAGRVILISFLYNISAQTFPHMITNSFQI